MFVSTPWEVWNVYNHSLRGVTRGTLDLSWVNVVVSDTRFTKWLQSIEMLVDVSALFAENRLGRETRTELLHLCYRVQADRKFAPRTVESTTYDSEVRRWDYTISKQLQLISHVLIVPSQQFKLKGITTPESCIAYMQLLHFLTQHTHASNTPRRYTSVLILSS